MLFLSQYSSVPILTQSADGQAGMTRYLLPGKHTVMSSVHFHGSVWGVRSKEAKELVNDKELLTFTAEGADDISETGVIPWSYKTQEPGSDGVQNCWKYLLEGLCVKTKLWLWSFCWTLPAACRSGFLPFGLAQHPIRVTVGLWTMRDGDGCSPILECLRYVSNIW